MRIRTIDLFCGGGGSSWGAQAAGVKLVAAIDAWGRAVETYRDNFPGVRVLEGCLGPKSGPEVLGALGRIDLILASPECTHHTCARGAKPRDEASRDTARYVLKFAQELKPRWLVIENVVHMLRWPGYEPLLDELGRNYNVNEERLDASDFGVGQNRRRLFLVCDRERLPPPVRPPPDVRPVIAWDIIDWNEEWPSTPLYSGRRAAPTLARAERAIAALGRGVPFLIVYYGSDAAGGWQSLDRPLRTLTTLDRFGLVQWRNGEPVMRMLQVPELRRAMGFDDNYRLDCGTRRDKVRILGNGVCPPVMKAIVSTLTRRG